MKKEDKAIAEDRKKYLKEIKELKAQLVKEPRFKMELYKQIAWAYGFLTFSVKSLAVGDRYEKVALEYMNKRIQRYPNNGQYYADLAGLLELFYYHIEDNPFRPEVAEIKKLYFKALRLGTENDAGPWFVLAQIFYDQTEYALKQAHKIDPVYYNEIVKRNDVTRPMTPFECMYDEVKR